MLATAKKTCARQKRYDITGWLFCLPAILFGAVFLITPIVMAFAFSFTDYNTIRSSVHFVGLQNYADLFKNAVFGKAIMNTIQFAVFVVPLQCGLALVLALLVNHTGKGFGIFKLAYFAPVITSMTVVALLFQNFYARDGLFNIILGMLGLPKQGFLNDPGQAMYSIIFMSAWQGAGYQMIILLAGLQNVQPELYEAASLDGAGAWQKFRNVTLPGILSVAQFVLLITIIGAFKLFTQPFIMTQGGPSNSTKTVVLYIYERGMQDNQVGIGSAIAMLFTLAFVVANVIGKAGGKLAGVYRRKRDEFIEECI
ncbi:MAG: sugar ABC transporter permease [Clostridiales bacterium]|nr:sugar ABC transporter permease [Clostridiales bacterium]